MNVMDSPPAFVAPAPAKPGSSSGSAESAGSAATQGSPSSPTSRQARFGKLLKAAQAPEPEVAAKTSNGKGNPLKRGGVSARAAGELNPDATVLMTLPPALAPTPQPETAAWDGAAPHRHSVDAAGTSRPAHADADTPAEIARANTASPSGDASSPKASATTEGGTAPASQDSARSRDKAGETAEKLPARPGSVPTDSQRPGAHPRTPDAAGPPGNAVPTNAVPTNAAPTSGDDADATLASAQSQVEAFAKGLQLARQTAHGSSPGKAGAALGLGRGLAGTGTSGMTGPFAAAEALATSKTLTGSAASHLGAASAAADAADAADSRDSTGSLMGSGNIPGDASTASSAFQQGNSQGFNGSANASADGAAANAAAQNRPVLTPIIGSGTWGLALSQHLVKMVQASQHSAEMQLNPPALGPLKITLSLGDQPLDMRFEATQPEVTQALEAALPQLHRALSEQGITVGHTSVQHGGGWGLGATLSQAADFSASSFSGGQQGTGDGDKGQRTTPSSHPASASIEPNASTIAPRRAPPVPGGLDTYA